MVGLALERRIFAPVREPRRTGRADPRSRSQRHPELAANALERLSEIARASGTEWALGIEARSRALLREGDAAERLYLQAIQRVAHTVSASNSRAPISLYGEWLRRERRRLEARAQLRTEHEMCTRMGLEAFARRAEREPLATAERAQTQGRDARRPDSAEAQIARLARGGLSNPEIGTRLFISSRTVEHDLHKAFTTLGISSRNQLGRAVPADPSAACRCRRIGRPARGRAWHGGGHGVFSLVAR